MTLFILCGIVIMVTSVLAGLAARRRAALPTATVVKEFNAWNARLEHELRSKGIPIPLRVERAAVATYDEGGMLPDGVTLARHAAEDEEYEGKPMSDADWQRHAYGPDTIHGIVQATIDRIEAELDKPYAIARAWAEGTLVTGEQHAERILDAARDQFEQDQAAAQLQQAHRELAWIYDGGVGAAGIESSAHDARFAFGQLVERKRREIATRKALGVGNAGLGPAVRPKGTDFFTAHGVEKPIVTPEIETVFENGYYRPRFSSGGIIDDTGDTVEIRSFGHLDPIKVVGHENLTATVIKQVDLGIITVEQARDFLIARGLL